MCVNPTHNMIFNHLKPVSFCTSLTVFHPTPDHVSYTLQAPDYFDIVKLPMDFQRMRNKINKFEYASLLAMVDDIRRIFYNCQLYNMPTAPEYLAGQKMSRYFERRLRELSIDQYLTQSPSKSPVKGQKGKRK